MAAEVRSDRLNDARKLAQEPILPKSTLTPPSSSTMRPNKFAIRLLLGGGGCACIGLWWLEEGIRGGKINEIIGGLLWKGPLLLVTGLAAVYYGFRMMTVKDPNDPNQKPNP